MALPSLEHVHDPPDAIAAIGSLIRSGLPDAGSADGVLRALFNGTAHPRDDFAAVLTRDGLHGLLRYGLLAPEGRQLRARFSLRSISNLLIVTDLPGDHHHVSNAYVDPLWEAPGIARLLCVPPGGTCLDMGTGSGVLALIMAQRAAQVTGVDINRRALDIARFNATLNGVTNIRFIESSLFAGLGGQTFDLIAFNAPTGEEFAPQNLQHAGDAILRAFFSAAPAHLAPGGLIQINLCGKDWAGLDLLSQIDAWLAPRSGTFRFAWLEQWRTTRGVRFFARRLIASISLRMNAFRCTAFTKGLLTLKEGPIADSLGTAAPYHDWGGAVSDDSAQALIRSLIGEPVEESLLGPLLAGVRRAARPVFGASRQESVSNS